MQQFIPFEDDWDLLTELPLERLVPYRRGPVAPSLRRAATDSGPDEEQGRVEVIKSNQPLA
jgi:hypothetical protein